MVTPVAQGGLGYDGLFLDDVGRFYDAQANDPAYGANQAADDMIAFVNEIANAIKAVNPDAYISINGGAYLGSDSTGGVATPDYQEFLTHIDGLLMENQFDPTTSGSTAWQAAFANYPSVHSVDYLA